MRVIGKKQKGYFGISNVWFNMGYIIVQGGVLYWLVSLFLIGTKILIIEGLLEVMFSTFFPDLSLGIIRNNRVFIFLQQKQRTE